MLIVLVSVDVKKEFVEDFKKASSENAADSLKESGIARFDVIQDNGDPTKFVLVEIYKTNDAPAAHKETRHYLKWKETVEKMMAKPRSSQKFTKVFPPDAGF